MEGRATTHPTEEILRALGVGILDDAAVEPVLAHLETCHNCQTHLGSVSGGISFAQFRALHNRRTGSSPAKPLSNSVASPLALAEVLPELHNHPDYEVLRELGRGGMGVVYLAKNKLMDREEVLKVVNQQLLGQDGAVERFLREIRSAAKLNHPNIVTAYTTLKAGKLLIFAMEYVLGDDLAKVVKTHSPLPVANACFYIHQAALGLQHASEKGMIHRDIKPGNLILAREGKKHIIKILDFGLAKATREGGTASDLTGQNQMLGTPDYIAPEQALDATRADIRADIYSLGCSLHYLLTGCAPFKAKSLYELLQAHMSKNPTPVDELRPEVPANLSAVIVKMMAKDPAERYQTPADVARALAPLVKTLAPLEKGSVKTLPTERGTAVPDPWSTLNAAVDLQQVAPVTADEIDSESLDRCEFQAIEHVDRPRVVDGGAGMPALPFVREIGIEMRLIAAGTFWMGSPESETDRDDDETLHMRAVSRPFFLAAHPVTRGQFRRFVESEQFCTEAERGAGAVAWDGTQWKRDTKFVWRNPGFKQDDNHPVVCVSYRDAVAFCKWLSNKTQQPFGLPTEEQWEYACRGRAASSGGVEITSEPYHFGTTITPKDANFSESRIRSTTAVGAYPANGFGLFDMHGNVSEWCADWFNDYDTSDSADRPTDKPSSGADNERVRRGGSWHDDGQYCRAAFRVRSKQGHRTSDLGFRVCLVPSGA